MIQSSFLYRYIYLFPRLILTAMMLGGCVDLSGSRAIYQPRNTLSSSMRDYSLRANPRHTPFCGEVHTMRGGLGIFSIGMIQLRDYVAKQYQTPAFSTMWYNAGNESRYLTEHYYQQINHCPIILIGHSLGANEQIKVARNLNAQGIPVALLVTVDAVSQTIVPPNVHKVLNIYKPGYVPMFSGLKLRAVNPNQTQIENINVNQLSGLQVNHFTIDQDKVVQTMILERVKKVLTDGENKRKQ